ncbi:MAG: hypothetical protein ACYTKD_23970, partial [Planctomycetota bacterium]
THALTGRRFRRSTGSKIRRVALARAQQFEEAHQREVAGLSKFEGYRRPLDAFLDPFLESLSCGPKRQVQLESQLRRAFRLLGLELLADLEDFTKIEAKVLRLNGKNGFTPTTIAVCFQAPLKQFSRYLAGRREILADHLAAWPALKRSPPKRKRRAILPDEMARILAASDYLDAMWPRRSPMRPVWTALLVAAPRVSALAALDVGDLDREHGRLLIKGNDTKKAGAGALGAPWTRARSRRSPTMLATGPRAHSSSRPSAGASTPRTACGGSGSQRRWPSSTWSGLRTRSAT